MKWLKRTGLALAALLVIVVLAAWWLLGSQAGLRFALARAVAASGGSLTVQSTEGHLAGPFQLRGVRYHDAADGVDARVDTLRANVRIWPLLIKRAHVLDLSAQGVQVTLTPPTRKAAPEPATPFSLQAPLDIKLNRVHVADIKVIEDGKPVFVANTLDLAGAWTAHGIDLRQLRLRAPDGHADLSGRLVVAPGYSGNSQGDFAWKVGDNTWAGKLSAHSGGKQAKLQLNLSTPLQTHLNVTLQQSESLPWTARMDVPRFDPQPLLGDTALKSLALALTGSGDRNHASLQGNIQLNDTTLHVQPLTMHFDDHYKQVNLDQLTLTSPQIEGTLHASGVVQLDTHPLSTNLVLNWRDVRVPADLAGQELASRGDITVNGSADAWHSQGHVDIGPPGKLAKLDIDMDGTPQQIVLNTLALQQPQGGLDATGKLVLQPQLGWDLTAKAHALDPGQLFSGWNGNVDFDLATHGQWADAGPDATLQLNTLKGTLRHRPISGKGDLHLHPNRVVEGTLNLQSGHSTLDLKATGSQRNNINLDLDVASLSDWLRDASGSLHGRVHVGGLWPKLAVKANIDGSKLSYGAQRLATLKLHADIPDISHPGGTLVVHASDANIGDFSFANIAINGNGNAASHRLQIKAQGDPLSLELALNGHLRGKNWTGTLGTLTLDIQKLPPWRLTQPAQLTWNGSAGSLAQTCLSAGDPQLCISASRDKKGTLTATYRLQRLPLALLTTLASGSDLPLRGDGVIDGDGKITRSAAGTLSGNAQISSAQGTLHYGDNDTQPLLDYRNLNANMVLNGDNQHLTVTSDFNDGGKLRGDVVISGPQQALSGQIDARLNNLAFIELFSAEVANVKGSLNASLKLDGTLAQPVLGGQALVDGLTAEIPGLGLKLHDGHITAATGDGRQLRIDGRIQSGDGTLTVSGNAGLGKDALTDLKVDGSKVTLTNIPSAKLVISPDLRVQQNATGMDLTGKLGVDSGDVKLEKLPGAGATQASPDVVVVDADQEQQEKAQSLPISTDIQVDFGQHMHVVGYGLDGKLTGQLHVRDVPGKFTTGQGQLNVDGTFRAYGQDLHIQHGRLLFAGTPIDNPGLNIRAIRKLNPNATIDEGDEVGLQITGTAKHPVLTVFSKPTKEQSDALSYLITGKPLSQVKGGEGNLVGAAAQALGSAAGDLLAKRIGSKLGVDEIGVSNNEALGTSAFTVGKYLSPRLYLSYGVGLFEPGQVVTLRYVLSSHWNFEAEQATDFSRASFNYRLER